MLERIQKKNMYEFEKTLRIKITSICGFLKLNFLKIS